MVKISLILRAIRKIERTKEKEWLKLDYRQGRSGVLR